MKSKHAWGLIITCIITMSYGGIAVAVGDPEAGAVKFETCAGCHSRPGAANAYPRYKIPKVGGQHADYIVSALKAYSSGSRSHGSMQGNARGISDADMKDIAAYLETIEYSESDTPVTADITAGKEKSESCGVCHGEDGNSTDPNFPHLSSQYQSYLVKTLQDYQTEDRKNPMMNSMVEELSEQDIEDIAAYFASQGKGLSVVND